MGMHSVVTVFPGSHSVTSQVSFAYFRVQYHLIQCSVRYIQQLSYKW